MMSASATLTVNRGGPLGGTPSVPGDKSMTHRALILAGLARGESRIDGALDARDTRATAGALTALGASICWSAGGAIRIRGCEGQWQAPSAPLDLGNSGTGLRLLAGALVGRGLSVILDGDESLRRRPMARISQPLSAMGAVLETRDGCPPVIIKPGDRLRGIDYRLPMGSAQVKSALLLAGLAAQGPTRIVDPFHTRDHSERMLPRFGANLHCQGEEIVLQPGRLKAAHIALPADPSSAAFLAAAALLAPGSELTLPGVGVNPTRTGFFNLLLRMGADLEWCNQRALGAEPVADLHVRASSLSAIHVDALEVPAAIDELPVLMVLAATAKGETIIDGAGELRHKESDRIATMQAGLAQLGAGMNVCGDRISLAGGGFKCGGAVDAAGDHRVAMALALTGLVSPAPVTVRGAQWIETSFPGFAALMRAAGATLQDA